MGIDYGTTLFFGFTVTWDRVRAWIIDDLRRKKALNMPNDSAASVPPPSSSGPPAPSDEESGEASYESEESEEDYGADHDIFETQYGTGIVVGGKYKFEFIRSSPHYDCSWDEQNFAFGVERYAFSTEDMLALGAYTTLEGYDNLLPILEALGVSHMRPSITTLLDVS